MDKILDTQFQDMRPIIKGTIFEVPPHSDKGDAKKPAINDSNDGIRSKDELDAQEAAQRQVDDAACDRRAKEMFGVN